MPEFQGKIEKEEGQEDGGKPAPSVCAPGARARRAAGAGAGRGRRGGMFRAAPHAEGAQQAFDPRTGAFWAGGVLRLGVAEQVLKSVAASGAFKFVYWHGWPGLKFGVSNRTSDGFRPGPGPGRPGPRTGRGRVCRRLWWVRTPTPKAPGIRAAGRGICGFSWRYLARKNGAGDRTRTGNIQLGKLVLYH